MDAPAAALTDVRSSATPRPPSALEELAAPPLARDKHPKLDSRLSRVARVLRERGGPAAAEEIRSQGLVARGSAVRAVVEMTDPVGARSEFTAASATLEAEYADLAQVLVPAVALERVAASSAVTSVRPPFRNQTLAVNGEGIAATGAAAWHAAGITGVGTKIAVIDLGFAGYPARQASGDLPASLTAVDMCSGQLLGPEPHGTAVAEIVHEMAPAAQLFLLCVDTEVQLGLAKDYAKANGIGIVNHSVGWFGTSRGDGSGGPGTPDAIVADARANGILWVNAAGNHSIGHWQGFFADADADGWNEFVPGDETNDALLLGGIEFCASLKWDDWPLSSQDYDLYLFRLSDLVIVASSTNAQTPAKPVEELCYTSPDTRSYGVAIRRASASAAPRFDLFVNNSVFQYVVASGSIVEPASSPNAMAVGAICWQNSALEFYSSLGPTIDGRVKPDIVGPDAVSTATYGNFSGCAISGFAGTSASAPHVAGAAALAKQANATFG
ncbi:MAG TPA: S8 family serine peptidase, partial [Candidatus Limnocylindria bacterium]